MIDILYLAKNRLEFTRLSLAALLNNTSWSRVRRLLICDDGSTDGTREFLDLHAELPRVSRIDTALGSPVAVMNHYLALPGADIFAKIDNDCMLPPGWLGAALDVMERNPGLDLLGIEPPSSTIRIPACSDPRGYIPCDSIGGVGLMRRSAFAGRDRMRPHGFNGVGGFTDWQLRHPEVKKGWLAPPIKLFLLDRMTEEPFASLSREYVAKGWQRPWKNYSSQDAHLWDWWKATRANS